MVVWQGIAYGGAFSVCTYEMLTFLMYLVCIASIGFGLMSVVEI